jgi:hypothetical protein
MSPRTRPQSRETPSPNFRILTITEALNQFRLNWQLAASKSSANELTQDSFDELLGLAKALTMEKDRLVKVETLQWVKEFGESLAEMDRSASEEGKK